MSHPFFQKTWKRLNIQLTRKEKLVFAKYLSVLLGAGLAIDEAIDVLRKQSKHSLGRILTVLSSRLKQGDTLSSGLMEFPHVFSPLFINLVASGEASGNLQENLSHLVYQMQKEYELTSKVRGAMIYPLVIISMAFLIAGGIFVFILPNVLDLFTSLDLELPFFTRILIAVTHFIHDHGISTAVLTGVAIILVLIARKIPFLYPFSHRLILMAPLIGSIVKKINLQQITRSLGTMIRGGITVDEAVNITASTIQNIHYKKIILELKQAIQLGNDLSSVFEKHPHLIPPMATRVIYVGEQAGSLDEMLLYLASFYETEVSEITENLSDLIEPFLLIVIGAFVGMIALSIMTPIYQVVGSF